jgi:heme A synthase
MTMLIVLVVIALLYLAWMRRQAHKRVVRAATIASVGLSRHDEPPLT